VGPNIYHLFFPNLMIIS